MDRIGPGGACSRDARNRRSAAASRNTVSVLGDIARRRVSTLTGQARRFDQRRATAGADARLGAMRMLGADPVLAVHDCSRSAAWYAAVFGCEVNDIGGWAFCRVGSVVFRLGTCRNTVPASEIGDHSYVAYLQVDDVDAFHERALAAGANVTKAPTTEPWGKREFAVRSPDGHRFMVGQDAPA